MRTNVRSEHQTLRFLAVGLWNSLPWARRARLRLGLISGEDSPLVDGFAKKVGITHVSKGCKEKGAVALRSFAASTGIALERIVFVGDEVNDLPTLRIAGVIVGLRNAKSPRSSVPCC